jgi:hypothetical protein
MNLRNFTLFACLLAFTLSQSAPITMTPTEDGTPAPPANLQNPVSGQIPKFPVFKIPAASLDRVIRQLAPISLLETLDDGTVCPKGQHRFDKRCEENSRFCHLYDTPTVSCKKCNFPHIVAKSTSNGDHCKNVWMWWAAGIFGSIFGMILLVWLTYYVWKCCVNARKSSYEKLAEEREIETQQI